MVSSLLDSPESSSATTGGRREFLGNIYFYKKMRWKRLTFFYCTLRCLPVAPRSLEAIFMTLRSLLGGPSDVSAGMSPTRAVWGMAEGKDRRKMGVNWLMQERPVSGFLRKSLSVLFKSIESGAGVLNCCQMPSD